MEMSLSLFLLTFNYNLLSLWMCNTLQIAFSTSLPIGQRHPKNNALKGKSIHIIRWYNSENHKLMYEKL